MQGLLSTTFVVDVIYRAGGEEEDQKKSLFVKVPLRGPQAQIYDAVIRYYFLNSSFAIWNAEIVRVPLMGPNL
jgi:hypothetical protein